MLRIFHGMLLRPLNNGIVADLQAAVDFLEQWPGVDPKRVGVIGFCMGGSYALQLAYVADPLPGSRFTRKPGIHFSTTQGRLIPLRQPPTPGGARWRSLTPT